MKVKVNENDCIGCGACCAIAPDVFDFNDEGYAEVIVKDEKLFEDLKDAIIESVESCPTNAIVEDKKEEN